MRCTGKKSGRESTSQHLPRHHDIWLYASRLAFQLGQRHAHGQIIPSRVVVIRTPAFVFTVDTHTVQQITLLQGLVDERFTGEKVVRNWRQIVGGKLVQFRGVALVITAIDGQGESDVQVPLLLLGPVL